MVKYYFFKTVRIEGHQKLRALAHQTTYKDYQHRNHPVDTNWDVQTERAARTIQCAYPDGTIFVARVEGARDNNTKLLVRSRNGQSFYRLESMTFPILGDNGNYQSEAHRPSADMQEAYQHFLVSTIQNMPTPEANTEEAANNDANRIAEISRCITNGQLFRLGAVRKESTEKICNSELRENIARKHDLLILRDMMQIGIVKFTYRKMDGTIRVAFGTRNPVIIPANEADNSPESRNNNSNSNDTMFYYDIQKDGWRAFRIDRFLRSEGFFTEDKTAVPAEA